MWYPDTACPIVTTWIERNSYIPQHAHALFITAHTLTLEHITKHMESNALFNSHGCVWERGYEGERVPKPGNAPRFICVFVCESDQCVKLFEMPEHKLFQRVALDSVS